MRLWTLHPRYLDRQGLTGLWREALLAKSVLARGRGAYWNHPQLERFKTRPKAIETYLEHVWIEANRRGYQFDASKFQNLSTPEPIPVRVMQVRYERWHLLNKLVDRSEWESVDLLWDSIDPLETGTIFAKLEVHPLFAAWEPHPLSPGHLDPESWETSYWTGGGRRIFESIAPKSVGRDLALANLKNNKHWAAVLKRLTT